MAKREILAGSVNQTIDVVIEDINGSPLTGLAYNSSGLTCYYREGATGTSTQLTLATQTVGGAHSDGGFVEIDATNMPGLYRLDLSDTMVSDAGITLIVLNGYAGMAPCRVEIEVVAVDKYNATNFGLSLVPTNVIQISGGSAAADNLEAAADGTGYNLGGGSVVAASVTGAVGSVTGSVGGNVTGSVGSVASFGTLVADIATAVWGAVTRTLTAGTNIVLAKGTGVTGFNDLSAAQVNAEVDTALADYDAPTKAELDAGLAALNDLDAAGVRSALGLAAANLDTQLDALPTAAEIVTALSNLNIDGKTWLAIQRVIAGRLAAKTSGLTDGYGTYVIRDAADTIDLLTIVVDADGNVTSVTWGI